MIIGLTGTYCAGKDSVSSYLQGKGFLHISLSDLLRNELKKQKKPCTRAILIKYANALRKKFGPSVLARVALNSMLPNRNYVISSIRSLFELEIFKSRKDFVHVHVDAPIKTRFQRLLKRTERKEDEKIKTFEEFKKSEESEKSNDIEKQQLHLVFKDPNVIINNNKTIKELHKKLDKFYKKSKALINKRPSWDEYFIKIIYSLASRSTCDRGRSGAVIVRNKRILSAGYVGSPVGLPHCNDVGHELHSKTHEDGTVSKHCVRTTHCEANAIAQAARHGISIENGTLYCLMTPCYDCAKLIINAGIKRVVAERDYHASRESKRVFKQAGVKLDIVKKELMPYAKQK